MTIPQSGQSIHLMNWRDRLCVLWKMRRKEGRNVRELALYTTDDLRRLYQTELNDLIPLRDGIVDRTQLVAVILWRVFWARFGYGILLAVSLISAGAAIIAAFEGWK